VNRFRFLPDPPQALAVIASATVCLMSLGDFAVGFFNDDVVYISLARSLLDGSGLRDLFLLGAPVHTQYPPGYPMLLAPLLASAPRSLVPMQLLSVAAVLVALVAVGRMALNLLSPIERAAVLFFCALNTVVLRFATTVLSDPMFLAVSCLLLTAWEKRANEHRPSLRDGAVLGLIAGASAWIRTVGVLWIVVLGAALLIKRETRKAGAALLVSGSATAGLLMAVMQGGAYLRVLQDHCATRGALGILKENLSFYAANLPGSLVGEPSLVSSALWGSFGIPAAVAAWAAVAGIGICVLCGLYHLTREGRGVWVAATAAFLVFFALWPYKDMRFLVPVFPILYIAAVRAWRFGRRWAFFAGAGAVLVSQSFFAAAIIRDAQAGSYRNRLPLGAYAWIREHAPAGAAALSFRYALWLYTGHQIVTMPSLDQPTETLLEAIAGGPAELVVVETADYIFEGGDLYYFARPLAASLDAFPDAFGHVAEDIPGRAVIYRLKPGRERLLEALGYARHARGDLQSGNLEEARRCADKALKAEPNLFTARVLRADLLAMAGELGASLNELRFTRKAAPHYLPAYLLESRLRRQAGQDQEAQRLTAEGLTMSRTWYKGLYDRMFSQ
jgi:tetratricopeptide (TPR) repeat protein